MKKHVIFFGTIILVLILGSIYKQSYISIWGFNIPKGELTNVIIYTKGNSYTVTDHNLVLALSKEVSHMKKFSKTDASTYPLNKKYPSEFTKILIQTKNKGTYGGSFWDDGNNIVLDSSGYYWVATNDLFNLMDSSLLEAQKLN